MREERIRKREVREEREERSERREKNTNAKYNASIV
jgi:hypothetical protein